MSSRTLTPIESIVLALGLKFIPRPYYTHHTLKTMLDKSLHTFQRNISLAMYFKDPTPYTNPQIPRVEHNLNPWSPPSSECPWMNTLNECFTNISSQALTALHSSTVRFSNVDSLIHTTLRTLSKDKNIIIKPADKNLGLVILDKSAYYDMCMTHLNDRNVYNPIADYSHPRLFAQLRQILKRHNKLHVTIKNSTHLTKLATSLLQLEKVKDHLRIAPFYCLPKIHKGLHHPIPGRPLHSSPSTPTYHASVFLDRVLQPLLCRLPLICTSSREIIQDISCTLEYVPADSTIMCADVASLYPSIPIDAGIKAIRDICRAYNHCLPDLDFLLDLLRWVLTENYCIFNNQIYHQIRGTAMGTPVAVTYANIYLYHLESSLVDIAKPVYYRRYIDDIFAVLPMHTAQQFVNTFNNQCDTIKLDNVTYGCTGIFLDLTISISPKRSANGNHRLSHTIYQKPINNYQYIPYLSSHQPHTLYNFILNEFKRYCLLCSKHADFHSIAANFIQRLLNRGYPISLITKALLTLPSRTHLLDSLKQRKTDTPPPRFRTPIAVVSFPQLYPQPNWRNIFSLQALASTEEYKKVFNTNNVIIGYKSPPNIASIVIRSTF